MNEYDTLQQKIIKARVHLERSERTPKIESLITDIKGLLSELRSQKKNLIATKSNKEMESIVAEMIENRKLINEYKEMIRKIRPDGKFNPKLPR
jgi:capsule polysaccharide export protein KpsE/RkpR